jgi:hypothetical protein
MPRTDACQESVAERHWRSDGPAEPAAIRLRSSRRPEPLRTDARVTPPPFDPDRARPRAVVYAHLSGEALTAGAGVARVEEVGPVLLGRLRTVLGERCTINLKPVIDLPAGHTPVDVYEIPASLREQLLLATPQTCSLRRRSQPRYRHRSHHPLPPPRQRRTAKPASATSDTTHAATTDTNPRWLAGPATRTRHLAVAITPPPHLPGQRHRHPSPGRHEFAEAIWHAANSLVKMVG